MIKNYFISAYRWFFKNKTFSLINIIGLSMGLITFLLIMQFVWFERSYDKFHKSADNIYRLAFDKYKNGVLLDRYPTTPCPIGPFFKENFSEISDVARLFIYNNNIKYGEVALTGKWIYYVDPSFLTIFSFPLVKGDVKSALKEQNYALISESMSKKIFGEQDPMGKTFEVNRPSPMDYKITGVFKDFPVNSHFKTDFIFSASLFTNMEWIRESWTNTLFYTYLLLGPKAHPKALETKINQLVSSMILKSKELQGQGSFDFYLQPLTKIHLRSDMRNDVESYADSALFHYLTLATVDYKNIDILFYAAIVILLFAWINFTNLNHVKSMERIREMGMRKVVGASRFKLVTQFIFESLLQNLVGFIIAMIVFIIMFSFFNRQMGIPANYLVLKDIRFVMILVLLLFFGAIAAALGPSLFISPLKPAVSLRGQPRKSGPGRVIIKGLVILQFFLSIALICGTMIIFRQVHFLQSKNLGFNKNNMLMIPHPFIVDRNSNYEDKIKIFKDEMKKIPGVLYVSSCWPIPGSNYLSEQTIRRADNPLGPQADTNVKRNFIDHDFRDAFQVKLLAGRSLSEKIGSDMDCMLINKKCMKLLGYKNPGEAIDQILIAERRKGSPVTNFKIIGVLDDYHQASLRSTIEPTVFLRHIGADPDGAYALRIKTNDIKGMLSMIENKYKEIFPGNEFDYYFLDDVFERLYQSDLTFGQITGMFALIAIIIGWFGLFGLVSYASVQRTKEIGVRKVLGASLYRILSIFSKEFLTLILISIVFALPIIFFLMREWMKIYAYRTDIGVWILLIPTLAIALGTLIVVNFTVFKIANMNPANSLRTE
jgi:putative ABC transport system permease protein